MKNQDLKEHILSIGGEILKETNPYEVARFVIKGQTGVIYKGKKGVSFSNKLAEEVYFNFENDKKIFLGEKKKRTSYCDIKDALLKKYGNLCFYTLEPMTEEEMSVEHLVPLSKGGANNIENMVLCKKEINAFLADKSLVEKILFREQNLLKKGDFLKKIEEEIAESEKYLADMPKPSELSTPEFEDGYKSALEYVKKIFLENTKNSEE